MKAHLLLLSAILAALPANAAPEIEVEISFESRTSGSTLHLANPPQFAVTNSIQFDAPEGPVLVSFPNVSPGEYTGQMSTENDEPWVSVTPLLVHPNAGTLSFTHDPGGAVTAFYRLFRVIDSCAEIIIRNTGDMPLSGIVASISGPGAAEFTLDDSSTAASLAPGETTTLTVCFTAEDATEHVASLQITSNDADENPFVIALVGDNDPGPIQSPGGPTDPVELEFTDYQLTRATATTRARISGQIAGPPDAVVALERSITLSSGSWTEVTRVTLDGEGSASVSPAVEAGPIGAKRLFLRLKIVP